MFKHRFNECNAKLYVKSKIAFICSDLAISIFNVYQMYVKLFLLDPYLQDPSAWLEIGESAAQGALRETWEEAGADVEVLSPFTQLDIPLIGQVRGHLCLLTLILHPAHFLKMILR